MRQQVRVQRAAIALLSSVGLSLGGAVPATWANPVLPLVPAAELQPVPLEADLWWDDQLWQDRAAISQAIAHSLQYLGTSAAVTAYRQYPVPGITRDRVRRSLIHFRRLLNTSRSPAALCEAVQRDFALYQSIGTDGLGTVSFTGYFEPTYTASRVPTAEFRYPLYRLPPDLSQWSLPHPSRAELEGPDGLSGGRGRLQGLELVWLRDRLEAFLIQVQGSARLQLVDGGVMSVGYAGRTEHPYVSLGRELINDGKLPEAGLTLPKVIEYFQQNPNELGTYIPRNNRFIFFRETAGAPPQGTLNVPVTAERSIATDKTIFPPGALALIRTTLPIATPQGLEQRIVSRYVLDQDTGGAIRGAGRVDIYLGSGELAGDRAGLVNHPGQLYYLLLK
ncbi:murein transglycosylase A [Leptolyngbya sp. AN02str]|uniref:murein transglycosylase A n=1 Tax=Leptolyngbya sp. AN02str TaxID=3423363 RepID=UPI003D31BC3D